MSLEDKLRELRATRQRVSVYSRSYLQAVWTLMIAYGGALKNQEPDAREYQADRFGSYYGSAVDCDPELTAIIADSLETGIGVDFDACSDPAQVTDFRFNNTFTSSQLKITVLYGKLVLVDGTTCWWGTKVDDEMEFGSLIQLLGVEITLNDAVEELVRRLDGEDPHLFSYRLSPALSLEHEERLVTTI